MYATGSREELEALTNHIASNGKWIFRCLREGRTEEALELAELNELFCGMLLQAIKDHFNGKN